MLCEKFCLFHRHCEDDAAAVYLQVNLTIALLIISGLLYMLFILISHYNSQYYQLPMQQMFPRVQRKLFSKQCLPKTFK